MSIILKPIITEKYIAFNEKYNRYSFVVDKEANKIEIKNALEKAYGVKVKEVNTQRYIGKIKNRSTKSGYVTGLVNRHKKAIVTLSSGDAIDFYSNI